METLSPPYHPAVHAAHLRDSVRKLTPADVPGVARSLAEA